MAGILEDLQTALNNFQSKLEADVAEVQKQKDAVQVLSEQIHNNVKTAKYFRDNSRIILSAPEIIIGNVDHNGNLLSGGGGSIVVVRGNNVSVEGAGNTGTITQRASKITSLAVDPGTDGTQAIVGSVSEVVAQGRSVTLLSNDDDASFVSQPGGAGTGVNIVSDTSVSINATPSCKVQKADIDAQEKSIAASLKTLQTDGKTLKADIDATIKALQKTLKSQGDYDSTDEDITFQYPDIGMLQQQFELQERHLCDTVRSYIVNLAQQAELNRRKKALDTKKTDLGNMESDFAKNPTGGNVTVNTERVSVNSIDGDGNIRENFGAGLFMQVPHVSAVAYDKKGELIKKSSLSLNFENVGISTANPKFDDKREKGEQPAIGNVTITTKTMKVTAVDKKYESKKFTEKELTKGGKLDIRFETVNVSNTDTEGKSTGKISLNAKTMNIAAMDVDKEKRTDKEMAAGSKLTILAEKNLMGTTKKTKLIQLASEKIGIMGKDTAEMQQDGKAVLTLSGGNVTAGGSAVEVDGNTTVKGKADLKGDVTAPKVTAQQGDFSAAFKSPTINDTMGAGVAAPAGTPSAKMTEEEAKTTE